MSKLIIVKQDNLRVRKGHASHADALILTEKEILLTECRRQIMWVLSLSNGLLSIFNTRYASFSFSRVQVCSISFLPGQRRYKVYCKRTLAGNPLMT
jgi:hypothetical protein